MGKAVGSGGQSARWRNAPAGYGISEKGRVIKTGGAGGWYHPDVTTDKALVGILTSNIFSKSEIDVYDKLFGSRVKKLGLKLVKIETATSGAYGGKIAKITQYSYEKSNHE